jgi:RNA polymerase sigma-70 factor (ECF subfamily)
MPRSTLDPPEVARRPPILGAGPEEAELVARAQRDPRAFAPLYDRYAEPVYRYCHRRLGEPEAAADVTALVFTRAIAALDRYREGSFRSWLFTIAHNAITDAFRARASRPEAPLDAAAELPDPARAAAPEEAALAAEARRSLLGALARLPDDQRRIVELRLAGLTGPEIAAVLGRSVGAVKIAQHRAYSRLRTILVDDGAYQPEGGPA